MRKELNDELIKKLEAEIAKCISLANALHSTSDRRLPGRRSSPGSSTPTGRRTAAGIGRIRYWVYGANKLIDRPLHSFQLPFQNRCKHIHVAAHCKLTTQLHHQVHLQLCDFLCLRHQVTHELKGASIHLAPCERR